MNIMKLIKRIGYVTPKEIGRDNVMLLSNVGPYLIKINDFEKKNIKSPIRIYPIVSDTERNGKVPVYLAVLSEQDYKTKD